MAAAGEPDVAQKLGEALKTVGTYEYGKDHGPLRQAEDLGFDRGVLAAQQLTG